LYVARGPFGVKGFDGDDDADAPREASNSVGSFLAISFEPEQMLSAAVAAAASAVASAGGCEEDQCAPPTAYGYLVSVHSQWGRWNYWIGDSMIRPLTQSHRLIMH